MRYLHRIERAPESELARYLDEAQALLSMRPRGGTELADSAAVTVSDDFEHLRWFDLPAVCLS
jgi:hypothetical protein